MTEGYSAGFPHSDIVGYNGWLPPYRRFSQATTSFIASSCQGIHRVRFVAWPYIQRTYGQSTVLRHIRQSPCTIQCINSPVSALEITSCYKILLACTTCVDFKLGLIFDLLNSVPSVKPRDKRSTRLSLDSFQNRSTRGGVKAIDGGAI